MKKTVLFAVVAAVAVVGGLVLASSDHFQEAAAGHDQKIHFIKTLQSAPSPGIGHESHQLVFILPINEGVMYEGLMTYTASAPVQIAIFHELEPGDNLGQPIWTNDQEVYYGWSLISPDVKAGSYEFAGSAVAFHTGGEEFVATVAVDGWAQTRMLDIAP